MAIYSQKSREQQVLHFDRATAARRLYWFIGIFLVVGLILFGSVYFEFGNSTTPDGNLSSDTKKVEFLINVLTALCLICALKSVRMCDLAALVVLRQRAILLSEKDCMLMSEAIVKMKKTGSYLFTASFVAVTGLMVLLVDISVSSENTLWGHLNKSTLVYPFNMAVLVWVSLIQWSVYVENKCRKVFAGIMGDAVLSKEDDWLSSLKDKDEMNGKGQRDHTFQV